MQKSTLSRANLSFFQYELRIEVWESNISQTQIEELRTQLHRELCNFVKEQIELTIIIRDEIPPLPSGKHQYCLKES